MFLPPNLPLTWQRLGHHLRVPVAGSLRGQRGLRVGSGTVVKNHVKTMERWWWAWRSYNTIHIYIICIYNIYICIYVQYIYIYIRVIYIYIYMYTYLPLQRLQEVDFSMKTVGRWWLFFPRDSARNTSMCAGVLKTAGAAARRMRRHRGIFQQVMLSEMGW